MREKHNFAMSPLAKYINCSEVEGAMCGSNGQCCKCSEWRGNVNYHVDLVRDDRTGFAICPSCGSSYGKDAMTGEEYRKAIAT